MKKLIGIILAVCMLSTMAFAATATYSNEVADMETMTVTVNYGGIAAGAQATLLAYDVTGVEGATAATAYVDEKTTPIKGIDQEPVDGTFSFKVADTYRGTLVVKIGGTDVDPVAFTVTFADAPEEPEGVEITVLYGDVDGDGAIGAADASLILQLNVGLIDGFTDPEGREIPETVGDVDGDGAVGAADASLVLQKNVGLIDGFTDPEGNALTSYTYVYVAPEA